MLTDDDLAHIEKIVQEPPTSGRWRTEIVLTLLAELRKLRALVPDATLTAYATLCDRVGELEAQLTQSEATLTAFSSALDRTEENFRRSVIGMPVRDMAENLGENDAARAARAALSPKEDAPDAPS